jgi:hypothetical protein
VISLAYQLLFRSGREALWRLAAIVGGVGIGVMLLLTILSGFTALNVRDERSGWRETEGKSLSKGGKPTQDALLWQRSEDMVGMQRIDRFDIAKQDSDAKIPGISRMPEDGEYYVSPALQKMISQYPESQLAQRFGDKKIGVIGKPGLGTSNELIAIVGQDAQTLMRADQVTVVKTVNGKAESPDSGFMRMVLVIGSSGVLFPAVMFIAVSTRLAAARREERFAAIRLAGGTKRQIAVLAAFETGAGAVLGVFIGYLLHLMMPYLLSNITLAGMQFYPEYMRVAPYQLLLVGVGAVAAAVATSFLTLRKLNISPLGIARKAPAKRPGIWRVIPLAAGLGSAAYMTYGNQETANEITMLLSFLSCGIGIFLVGPLLASAIAWLARRISVGPAGLIASSRLLAQPSAIFRSVSGIVIAIFVVSTFNTFLNALAQDKNREPLLPQSTLQLIFRPGQNEQATASNYQKIVQLLEQTEGVKDTATLYQAPAPADLPLKDVSVIISEGSKEPLQPDLLLPCSEAAIVKIKNCPKDKYVALPAIALFREQTPPEGWQFVSVGDRNLMPGRMLVNTNGDPSIVETLRTKIAATIPFTASVDTDQSLYASGVMVFVQMRAAMYLGMIIVLIVAGCGLLVAVADSLLERRRPFALLRLTGMTLKQLRTAVLLEAAIPLIATTVLAAAAGTLYGEMVLNATSGTPYQWPSAQFVLAIVAGIVLALAIVALTLPLLGKITRPENARFE